MAWEWTVLFVLLVLAGLASVAVGLLLVFGDSVSGRSSGEPSAITIGSGDRHFAITTQSLGLILITLALLMWGAAGLVVMIAGDDDGVTTTPFPTVPATFPPVGAPPTAAPVTPSTSPPVVTPTITVQQPPPVQATSGLPPSTTAAGTVIFAVPDLDSRPPTAFVEECDNRWAVALGSTQGEATHPDDFRDRLSAQYADGSLRLLQVDSCASLAPGTWVVIGGIYIDSTDAVDECRTRGLFDIEDCFALPLTSDPADRDRRIAP